MKKTSLVMSIAGLALGYAGFAMAAPTALNTCAQSAIQTITSTSTAINNANNCNNNTGSQNNISNVCSNLTSLNGAGADVYGLTIGANYSNVQITVTPTGWFAGIYVMPSSANNCGGNGQPCRYTTSPQASDTNPFTVTLPTGLAAGTYYIVVADASTDPGDNGCGVYNMSIAGTLPVKLQKFSVN